jgi:hypothetical protein
MDRMIRDSHMAKKTDAMVIRVRRLLRQMLRQASFKYSFIPVWF